MDCRGESIANQRIVKPRSVQHDVSDADTSQHCQSRVRMSDVPQRRVSAAEIDEQRRHIAAVSIHHGMFVEERHVLKDELGIGLSRGGGQFHHRA